MKTLFGLIATLSMAAAMAVTINAQQTSGQSHQHHGQQRDKKHHDEVNQRGDHAMGFSHAKTTHHFQLKTDGGFIEGAANDPQDTTSRDQIRQHLKHIARKFAAGDFSAPMFIHAQTPPGVPAMKRLKAEIEYQFEELERGGRVRVSTRNSEAINAIHEFLRFQIKDHKTGDSGEIQN
jgi:hypothetical protein